METSTKPQSAGERDGGGESDFSMPSLEEEHEDVVGGAMEHDDKMEEHGEVGVSTEEHDEDLYNQEQGGIIDKDEGVAKMCPDELGVGLRKRNRHD